MRITILVVITFFCQNIFGQITIEANTNPLPGEQLNYLTLTNVDPELGFNVVGENQDWNFDNLEGEFEFEEVYEDISLSPLGDSFPDANMLVVQLGFVESAAIQDEDGIRVIGLGPFEFGGIGVPRARRLEEPYVIRQTPLNFGDQLDDQVAFTIQFSSDIIPGLDSLELPIPGASLDSLRVVSESFKTEEVVGWGTLTLNGTSHEVLQVEQVDSTNFVLEVGLNVFGTIVWFDPTEFLGDMGGDMGGDFGDFFPGNDRAVTTYKFLSADEKTSIVEFSETIVTDSLDNEFVLVNGRIGNGITPILSDNEIEFEGILKAYPNPFEDYLILDADQDIKGSYKLYNDLGQVLLTGHIENGKSLDLSHLNTGMYYLLFADEEGHILKKEKFVKQ